jgi:parallel beta-helix repeat protein
LVLLAEVGIVYAGETIYIRADGSIEGTIKIQRDGNVYTFTGDISGSLVVERDHIVVDGAGHVLEGTGTEEEGTEKGIDLTGRSNVTIENMEIKAFYQGIRLWSSFNNTISGNNITMNTMGILLWSSSNNCIAENDITTNGPNQPAIWFAALSNHNSVYGNSIANNHIGIYLSMSSNNSISGNSITANFDGLYLSTYYKGTSDFNNICGNIIKSNRRSGMFLDNANRNNIYHNVFVDNVEQVRGVYASYYSINVWDDGYPSGGNYWSDYSGVDLNSGPYQNEAGSDGIGDLSYTIDSDNTDRYPLMGPISTFDCGSWDNKPYYADIVSNSTISAFNFNAAQKLISFNVNGSSATVGFCKITIDNLLLGGPYTVMVDETIVTPSVTSNGTHSFLYFTYAHSTHNVSIIGSTVIPESLLWIILPLLMIATLFAVAVRKKISHQAPQKS